VRYAISRRVLLLVEPSVFRLTYGGENLTGSALGVGVGMRW